jgi:cytochrome c-type biogenesis protein CcmH
MAVFWILATLMTLVALAIVLVPLLRARPRAAPSRHDANLEVLRSQRREIDADVASGVLPAEAREEALAELVGRAGDDLVPDPPAPTAAARKPWVVAGIAAVAIPAIAFGTYLALGNPAASDPKAIAASATPSPADDAKIVAMVESLARKVRDRPDDTEGWALLGRSMAALGRFREAADAYEHLMRLAPGDAQVMADYADVLGMVQGRTLAGRPYELARQALRIEPKNKKALALAGTAAVDAGEYTVAIGYWQRLAGELPPGSEDYAQVQAILGEIRSRATGDAKSAPPATAAVAQAQAPAAGGGKSITGSVSLAFGVSGHVSGSETLFIFARSEGGPRIPLAVLRASARELPMKFALDDSQSMAPGVKLSAAQAVRIEARISKSGNAMPQPGDLVGSSAVVKPGARDVDIVVDKVLK